MAGVDDHRRISGKVAKRRSSALRFLTTNPAPKAEANAQDHKRWEADYLKDLRANRPARPNGSRALPDSRVMTPDLHVRAASALSIRPSLLDPAQDPNGVTQERATSALSHRRAQSDMQKVRGGDSLGGRLSMRTPTLQRSTRNFSGSTTATNVPTNSSPLTYRESGMRWMEKQEARALREALEEMDVREDAKVHAKAQDEASALVWQHIQNGGPHNSRRNYREHLQEGAHARSHSQAWAVPVAKSEEALSRHRNHQKSEDETSKGSEERSNESPAPGQDGATDAAPARTHIKWDSPEKKAYTNLAFKATTPNTARRRSSGIKRRTSSGGPFRNPDDKIYEDPQEIARTKRSPSVASKIPVPQQSNGPDANSYSRFTSKPLLPSTRIPKSVPNRTHPSEIHRNPPSQSRDPTYVRNDPDHHRPNDAYEEEKDLHSDLEVDHREIRSDDIRTATSMRLKDRSPKLPSPSFISNKPGRHIISFDKNWQPRDKDQAVGRPENIQRTDGAKRFKPSMPVSVASSPAIPTINITEDSSINLHGPTAEAPLESVSKAVPAISVSAEPTRDRSGAAKVTATHRPLPHHSSTAPVHSKLMHWSPVGQRTTAQCAACALPISGRMVSAALQRFHPTCFTCHHCSEPLECVAFYPEPDLKRSERLARIHARLEGLDVPEDQSGETAMDDGDESLRFFCHLDFHELFSPRCRSCKTPIESEVVVACGGTWHVGHFFCAECGDPFDPQTPFVEKDGYAWCVQCHAGRFSGKCKGCRKPVVEQGINALGAEWHEHCFVCVVCLDVLHPVDFTDFA